MKGKILCILTVLAILTVLVIPLIPLAVGADIGGATFPTLTLSAPSSVTATSATLNGTVTYVGITNPTVTVYWGTSDGGNTAGSWANSSVPSSPSQPQGAVAFSLNITGLSPATVYYFNAQADNTGSGGGITWAGSSSFSTLSTTTTTTTTTTAVSTSIGKDLPIIFGVILIIAMLIVAVTTRSITAVIAATIICILGIFGIVLLENLVISIFGK